MNTNKIYTLLGSLLMRSMDVEFKEAYLEIQRITGSVEISGYYLDISGVKKPIQRLNMNSSIPAAIHELHDITTTSNNKWNRLLFKLEPTGKFEANFANDLELEKEIEFYKNGGKPQEWLAKKFKRNKSSIVK